MPFDKILDAMGLVKDVLDEIGLKGYPKTTGGDGMHVFVPVEPRYTYEQARSFAEIVSQVVIGQKPDLFTTPRSVAKRRKGRVYFDYLQISSGKTIAAPYVMRAYDGAPVATPLHWDEVKHGLTPKTFNRKRTWIDSGKSGISFKPVLTKPSKARACAEEIGEAGAGSVEFSGRLRIGIARPDCSRRGDLPRARARTSIVLRPPRLSDRDDRPHSW